MSRNLTKFDDSNGEVRFVIRDLENFQILTEITILSFFTKLEFFGVFQIGNIMMYFLGIVGIIRVL